MYVARCSCLSLTCGDLTCHCWGEGQTLLFGRNKSGGERRRGSSRSLRCEETSLIFIPFTIKAAQAKNIKFKFCKYVFCLKVVLAVVLDFFGAPLCTTHALLRGYNPQCKCECENAQQFEPECEVQVKNVQVVECCRVCRGDADALTRVF